MTGHGRLKMDVNQPTIHQIRPGGHPGPGWTDWFEGFTLTLEENSDTLLTSPVTDLAALHDRHKVVRDPGMPLVPVVQIRVLGSHQNESNWEK